MQGNGPRHGPQQQSGPDITLVPDGTQATHISLFLVTVAFSDRPPSTAREPFCFFLPHLSTIYLLIIVAPTWHHQGCNDPDWPAGVFYSHELSVTRSVCGYLQPGLTVRTHAGLWVSFICQSQVPPGGPVDTIVTSYFRFCHIGVPRTECLDCEPGTSIEDEQDSIYLGLFRVPLTLKQRSRKK